jgi:hypothetical protein
MRREGVLVSPSLERHSAPQPSWLPITHAYASLIPLRRR